MSVAAPLLDSGGHRITASLLVVSDAVAVRMASIGGGSAGRVHSKTPHNSAVSPAAIVKDRPGFMMVPNCLGVEGGVPILYEGECLGGVGVSGGLPEDDSACAQRAAEAGR